MAAMSAQTIGSTLGVAMRTLWLDTLAVLAPIECSGCGAVDRSLCPGCRSELVGAPHPIDYGALRVWSALEYSGVVRQVLAAYKDAGRTDAARPLAAALARAMSAALAAVPEASAGRIELATIPSTRSAMRRRGYRPVELLLGKAGLRASHPVRAVRQSDDQASLGRIERQANRAGSLRSPTSLAGRDFLIVDDIVTTGATLAEAARAITAAGGEVLAAATLAHTPRRIPLPPLRE